MTFRLEHIAFAYEARHQKRNEVFGDLSLDVRSGERVAILGAEGCGKSTLLALLGGAVRPAKGRVSLDGRDLWTDDHAARDLLSRIGWTFQSPDQQFLSSTVLGEILALPHLRPSDELTPRITSSLAALGLAYETFIERSPFTLSLGEARRFALALSLIAQPRALLMDEPTAGLDGEGIDRTVEAVLHAGHSGTTVIIATNDLEFARDVAERILILENGVIAADGPAGEVVMRREVVESFGY